MLKQILNVAQRECGILLHNPIYAFCMVVFPIVSIVFFTSLMSQGAPTDMPVGVVDQDNSSVSRKLIRTLDAFQSSHVVARYANVNEARRAIQRNEIYAFLYIPEGTAAELTASRQPKISFYYSNISLVAGSLLYKDLKTVATLGAAGAGSAKLTALGKTEREVHTFLQPITIDLHTIANPWTDYNVYLSATMIPAVLLLFVFLITAYSVGTELKFGRAKEWLSSAQDNIFAAVAGKLLPQALIFLAMFYGFELYVYGHLHFPHQGGILPLLLLPLLSVMAGQGFGLMVFSLMPSLRMSMSVCSLWAVLSFTTMGATFPVFSMSPMLEAVAQLFPMRHYYMVYQMTILNGFPWETSLVHWLALFLFALLPLPLMGRLKKAMLTYSYMP